MSVWGNSWGTSWGDSWAEAEAPPVADFIQGIVMFYALLAASVQFAPALDGSVSFDE